MKTAETLGGFSGFCMAPQVGLEPTTLRLTAECSAIELLRNKFRRRPTLPGRVQPSTIGAEGLNFCVRNGNRWDPFAIATGNCFSFRARLSNACPTRYFLSSNLHCVLPGSILPSTRSRLRIFTTAHLTLSFSLLPGLSLNEAFDLLVAATSTRYRASSAALSTC